MRGARVHAALDATRREAANTRGRAPPRSVAVEPRSIGRRSGREPTGSTTSPAASGRRQKAHTRSRNPNAAPAAGGPNQRVKGGRKANDGGGPARVQQLDVLGRTKRLPRTLRRRPDEPPRSTRCARSAVGRVPPPRIRLGRAEPPKMSADEPRSRAPCGQQAVRAARPAHLLPGRPRSSRSISLDRGCRRAGAPEQR